MRFLVDAQLPPALARWLVSRGHEAEHVADLELAAADDRTIWRHAASTGAVVVTKDEDFAILRQMEEEGPSILWVRIGNCRRQALLSWFAEILPAALTALERGELLVEMS